MLDTLLKLINTTLNHKSLYANQTELMKFFRAEYKHDADGAYEYWINTRKTDYF